MSNRLSELVLILILTVRGRKQGSANYSLKSKSVNIIDFVVSVVSVVTTELCRCTMKQP